MRASLSVRKSAPAIGASARAAALLGGTKLTGALLVLLLLAAWEISAANQMVQALSWPRLSAVLVAWFELIFRGEIPLHLLISLKRMFIGYALAVVLGVSLGVAMGNSRTIYNLLEPIVEMIRPLPSVAYIPIVILFLGIDDEMKLFMIAFAGLFPILLNTMTGVRNVDPVLIDTGRTLGLSAPKILRKILLPAATPYIFTGARISLATALILMVISEMIAANNGIGFFLVYTQQSYRVPQMYSGILTLAVLGYAFNRAFLAVEGRVLAWNLGYTRVASL